MTQLARRGPGKRRDDLTGLRCGRLTVLGPSAEIVNHRGTLWRCVCDCGGERLVRGDAFAKAHPTQSCGCLRDLAAATNLRNYFANGGQGSAYRHGHARAGRPSRTYSSWHAMRQRCRNVKATKYPKYGGRGITVCDRWFESFDAFLADMGVRPEGKTLDRKDPSGNYEPGNCRWATPYQQWLNRRMAEGMVV